MGSRIACKFFRPENSFGGSRGVPVLVPVRASPVPSVVRRSFVVKFSFQFAKHLVGLSTGQVRPYKDFVGRRCCAMVLVYHNQEWHHVVAAGRRSNGEVDYERMQALVNEMMREKWHEWRARIHREYLQPAVYLSLDLVFTLPEFCLILLLLCSASAA